MSDHEHHHEHEDHHHHEGDIDIHEHEGALAASFKKEVLKGKDEVLSSLSAIMKHLAKDLREEGAYIGHIKAAVKESDTVTMLSITKDILDEKEQSSVSCSVSFAAIVFNIHEHELKEFIQEVYEVI